MTTMIDKPLATDDDEFASPAFPPEHYGCPPWCTRNIRVEDENFISHDSADGLPDWPNFRGYRHLAGRWIPYAASGYPLSIYMDLEPGAAEPTIAISNEDDDDSWTEFSLDEAGQVASEIKRLVAAYGRCPAWCEDDHRTPADIDGHYTIMSIDYAAAPKDDHGTPEWYNVALRQPAPEINLCGGLGMLRDEIRLTLTEAEAVAVAITELLTAATAAMVS